MRLLTTAYLLSLVMFCVACSGASDQTDMAVIDFSRDACGDACVQSNPVTALSLGSGTACALFQNGKLKCWGGNSSGQLGLSDTKDRGDKLNQMGSNLPYVDVGTGRTVKAVSVGGFSVCAILDNGAVKCWGGNVFGQLGLGDTSTRGDNPDEMGDNLPAVDLGTGRTAKAISLGTYHACALLDDNSVKCWGANDRGYLGLEDTNHRGDNKNLDMGCPSEMGDCLPAVNLGFGRTAKAIACGESHTCAILDDNSVKCWGVNNVGQLGLGDVTSRGDKPNQMGNNLPPVNLDDPLAPNMDMGSIDMATILDMGDVLDMTPVAQDFMLADLRTTPARFAKTISVGGAYTCVVLSDNSIKCWGFNTDGELGLGDSKIRGIKIEEMGNALPSVSLGSQRSPLSLTTGYLASCVILDNHSVKCWGSNHYGALGLGDEQDRGSLPGQMGDSLPALDFGTGRNVKLVAYGRFFGCAVLDNGGVKCWGNNDMGRLGLGDTLIRGANSGEMGDNLPYVSLE